MKKVISKDGTPIAYNRQGEGPPLVLVHGNGVVANNWMMVMPALAENFTVYAVDRRGRGESGDNDLYAIEREFEDIAAVVDSINQPVNLLGHSFGGILTLEGALLTKNVRKLILYEPTINLPDVQIVPGGLIEPMEKLINVGQKEEALLQFYESIGIPPSEIELMQTLPEWEARVAIAHTVLREISGVERRILDVGKFTDVPFKTLFLIGEDGSEFWDEVLQVLNHTLPGFSTDVLPGQGHLAMNTAPDLFVDAVTRFFKD